MLTTSRTGSRSDSDHDPQYDPGDGPSGIRYGPQEEDQTEAEDPHTVDHPEDLRALDHTTYGQAEDLWGNHWKGTSRRGPAGGSLTSAGRSGPWSDRSRST